MKHVLYLCVLLCFALSCTEEYDLELNKSEKYLVIDGMVTNWPGPYFVRVTWSKTSLSLDSCSRSEDGAEPIKDAVITIADNIGNIDTLVPVTSAALAENYNISIKKGYYQTSNIQGVAGRTYTLTVAVNNKIYTSSCYMTPISYTYKLSYRKKIYENDGQVYYVPLLYYTKNPAITSYYAFSFSHSPNETVYPINRSSFWDYSIMSDEYLDTNVNGITIDEGTSSNKNKISYFFHGETIPLTIFSITKETYNYYNGLIQQFISDGGAYKPTPTSPKGNISNGALGFFSASAMSYVKTTIPY